MSPRRTLATAAVLVTVAVAACAAAHAASLGGLGAAHLYAGRQLPVTGHATVTDTFAGTSALGAHLADTGQPWTVHAGTFSVGSGVATPTSKKVAATATVPVLAAPAATVSAQLTPAKRTFASGLVIAGTADGTSQLWVQVSDPAGGTLTVTRLAGGTETTLYTRTGVGAAAGTLTVARSSTGTLTMTWGSSTSTFTLAAADQSLARTGVRAGLLVYLDGWASFDNFTWTTP